MADKIRITKREGVGTFSDPIPARDYIEGFGKSTVTKPTGVAQGSWIFETDTKQVKFYDEESESWG